MDYITATRIVGLVSSCTNFCPVAPECWSDQSDLRNRDRTDPNYHADWSKYQAMSIKLGMNQFSLLFSQKAEASMARIALESTFTGWYKPFMSEVDNLIYQMGNVK
ncbi:hypothetical protein EMCRGX_G027771 [Ephydatia muelleri]